jgi:hypothetical protein
MMTGSKQSVKPIFAHALVAPAISCVCSKPLRRHVTHAANGEAAMTMLPTRNKNSAAHNS